MWQIKREHIQPHVNIHQQRLQQDDDDGFDVVPTLADWGAPPAASQVDRLGVAAEPDSLPPCPPGTGDVCSRGRLQIIAQRVVLCALFTAE